MKNDAKRCLFILDDPKAGMYSCEVTTTGFRSMIASADMSVIGGLVIIFFCINFFIFVIITR